MQGAKLGGEKLFQDYPNIVSAMPGFGEDLSEGEIWSILAFIKPNWSEEMREFQKMASKYEPLPEKYSFSRKTLAFRTHSANNEYLNDGVRR